MYRLLIGITISLTVAISVLVIGARVVGKLFPSEWVFTAIGYECFTPSNCPVWDQESIETLVIDGDHRLFTSVLNQQTENIIGNRIISPNGQFVVTIEQFVRTTYEKFGTTFTAIDVNRHFVDEHGLFGEVGVYGLTIRDFIWSTDATRFYFHESRILYRYDFLNNTLDPLFIAEHDIAHYVEIPNTNYIFVQLENGDLFRINQTGSNDVLPLLNGTTWQVVPQYFEQRGLAVVWGNEVLIIDVLTGEVIDHFVDGGFNTIHSIEWSPNGHWLTVFENYSLRRLYSQYSLRAQRIHNIDIDSGEVFTFQPDKTYEFYDHFSVLWSTDETELSIIHFADEAVNLPAYFYITEPTLQQSNPILERIGWHYDAYWLANYVVFLNALINPSNADAYMVDLTDPSRRAIHIESGVSNIISAHDNTIYYLRMGHIYTLNLDNLEHRQIILGDYYITDFVRWE